MSQPPAELSPQDRETLEGVAERHEVVFDGEVLDGLLARGFVILAGQEWTITPAGLDALGEP